MLHKIINLVFSFWGWSFRSENFTVFPEVLFEGEYITLQCTVHNECSRIGTAYVRFLVAEAYSLNSPLFDSDRDLSQIEKQRLRLWNIQPGNAMSAAQRFRIPNGYAGRPFDVRVQIWNPRRLFNAPRPWKFFDSGWKGGFEVVTRPIAHEPVKVFISYSWDSQAHRDWVKEFGDELRKHNLDVVADWKDLQPGEEATLFMERGVVDSRITILICTETYTRKANERSAGVGYETILSANEYLQRTPEERARIIPIVRENNLPTRRKIPLYLGSAIYVDMSGPDWRAGPMLALVVAISRIA